MELNLEVGKSYKNNRKKKVNIIGSFHNSGRTLFIGVAESGNSYGDQYCQMFSSNGAAHFVSDTVAYNDYEGFKLISEWSEPKPPYKVEKYFAEIKPHTNHFEVEQADAIKALDLDYFDTFNSVDELKSRWGNKVDRIYKVTVESVDDDE